MEALRKKEKVTSPYPEWSGMAIEMLELVCKRLRIPDQLRFSSVCKTWLSSASDKAYLWLPDTPWLITNDDVNSEYRLFSPTDQKNFMIEKPFQPLHDSFIAGSFKGWLVIRSETQVFILNLFSHVQIELPPRTTMPDALKAKGINPTGMDIPLGFAILTCDKLNPIYVATVTFAGDLAWCKIGDKAWKGHRGRGDEEYANLTFYNDKLYAIRRDGSKIDIFQVEDESPVLLSLGSIDYPPQPNEASISDAFDFYLVESKRSLIVVKMYYDNTTFNGPTIGFDVLKVEEKCSPQKLVNVDNLEGQALFLSDMNCESLPGKDCPGLQGDRIYFIGHSNGGIASELGVFLVQARRFLRVPLAHTNMDSPVWVLARFAFECKCKCHDSALWRCKQKKKKMLTAEN